MAVLLKTAAEHIGSNKNDNSYGNGHYLAIWYYANEAVIASSKLFRKSILNFFTQTPIRGNANCALAKM